MDYADPALRSLHIALIRLPATDQKHRLGSLVINPGGPGGSGIDYARQAKTVISSAVRKRYDVVGFDPRGVGRSDPVHCLTAKETDAVHRGRPDTDDAGRDRRSRLSRQGFRRRLPGPGRCRCSSSWARGTRPTTWTCMRSALGDAKLNYLGKSYGTYLGATYADEFPTHVGAMVLDGVLDPSLTSEQINLGQAKGFELATRSFLADCVKRSSCPMGRNLDQAVVKLGDFLRGLDAHPLPTKDSGRPLTEGWGTLGRRAAALQQELLAACCGRRCRQAMQGNGQGLLTLADAYAERNSNGSYQDNSNDALYAVNCQDHPQPGGLAQIESDATLVRGAGTDLGQHAGVGFAGLRLLAEPADRRAEGHHGGGQRADPGGRHHPRPGHAVRVGGDAVPAAGQRTLADLQRRRAHGVPAGEQLRRHGRRQLPAQGERSGRRQALLIPFACWLG